MFSISVDSAGVIQGLLDSGPVEVQLEGSASLISEAEGQSVNVVGVLPGTRRPDEYVVYASHIDAWWGGALDDTAGVATVLEIARAFSRGREAGTLVNERTIVFLTVGSHEFGGPSETWYAWDNGSYEFVKRHSEVLDRAVLVLNMDVVNFESVSRLHLTASWEIADFAQAALSDLEIYDSVLVHPTVPSTWTDAWAYSALGGASKICCGGVGDLWDGRYHTQLDDLTILGNPAVPDFVQAYALLGLRAAGKPA